MHVDASVCVGNALVIRLGRIRVSSRTSRTKSAPHYGSTIPRHCLEGMCQGTLAGLRCYQPLNLTKGSLIAIAGVLRRTPRTSQGQVHLSKARGVGSLPLRR